MVGEAKLWKKLYKHCIAYGEKDVVKMENFQPSFENVLENNRTRKGKKEIICYWKNGINLINFIHTHNIYKYSHRVHTYKFMFKKRKEIRAPKPSVMLWVVLLGALLFGITPCCSCYC